MRIFHGVRSLCISPSDRSMKKLRKSRILEMRGCIMGILNYFKEEFIMLRNCMKRLASCMLVCALTVGMFSTTAYAASSTSVSGKISTGTVTGSLLLDGDTATATTSFSWGGGTRYATAYVYYWLDDEYYYSYKAVSSTQSGGVAAAIEKQKGGADVLGAKGVHRLVYDPYTWSEKTTLGTIPTNPTYVEEKTDY